MSLEVLINSSPLFALQATGDGLYIGTSDFRLGIKVESNLGFDVGFFNNFKPHGHCRRVEVIGNFIDGTFIDGELSGIAVCYLQEIDMWTYGLYKDY